MDRLRKKLKSQTSNANKALLSAKKTGKNSSIRKEIEKKITERDNERKFKQKLSIENEYCKKISFHEYNNHSVDTWVEDTLNFIEGCDKIKCGNKKTEKKARQKLKKEESKRIEELYDLRSQYHDLYFKEFTSKNELKEHKSAKKKDKKLMVDLELNIKRLSTGKIRVETRILELLTLVKSISPAFKFAYLPTREQQLEILQKNSIPKQQTIHKHEQVAESSLSTNNVPQHLTLNQCNIIPFTQTIPICEKQSNDCKNDPSKRIVTIRRINLPHVSEPQVTVTAKGVSPDKDKLLYTFVNGQLVPATSLDSLTLKILRPLVPKTKLNKKLPQEHMQSYSNDKKSLKPMLKTKTQLKKDRRIGKNLALEAELKKELNENINSTFNKETRRSRKHIQKQIINSCVTTYGKTKKNCSNEVSLINTIVLTEPAEFNIGNQQLTNKSNFKTTVSNVINMENLKKIKKHNKQHNNQVSKSALENNQFKLLHFDNSSSSEESEIELKLNTIKSSTIKTHTKIKRIRKKNEFMNAKQIFKTDNLKQKHEKIDSNILPKIENVNKGTQSSSLEKNVMNAESMAMSLQNSMQKLNINADTTIEIAKDSMEEQSAIMHLNISIMEQINKGVQVEKLTLPPGITLTKVDPVKAELLRAQRESIGKLLKPMKKQLHSQQNEVPSSILADLKDLQHKQSGIIMVDTMNNKSKVKGVISDNNQSKKKKFKRKTKLEIDFGTNNSKQASKKFTKSKMITLRNPMFHGANYNEMPVSVPSCMQMPSLSMDQPAAIIKNDNGMFTIRNPALQQAFSNSMQNNYAQYNPYCYTTNIDVIGKSISNITCENRSSNKQKAPWQPQAHNNYILESVQEKYQQLAYYNKEESVHHVPKPASLCNIAPSCNDPPLPLISTANHYLDDIPHNNNIGSKYDDVSFFKTLMPGRRLNSEVTIHNINESKFSSKHASEAPHGVEITPISSFTTMHVQDIQNPLNPEKIPEFGDNLFAPNQTLNLSELESDERDIESFKRFSYGFEPPKNKPKVHININDLLVNNKKLQNTRSSSYFPTSMDNFVNDVSSLKISSKNSSTNSSSNINNR